MGRKNPGGDWKWTSSPRRTFTHLRLPELRDPSEFPGTDHPPLPLPFLLRLLRLFAAIPIVVLHLAVAGLSGSNLTKM